MTIDEVPQDQRDFRDGEKLKKLVYAVGSDGKYTGIPSAGWEAENFVLKQAWDDIEDTLAETEQKVRSGQLSPIAWFMHKNLMDIALLAKYAGKWQWQVKNHMKPEVFKTLSPAVLNKYAAVFNITVDELIAFGKG
jgi:hypothetical protein